MSHSVRKWSTIWLLTLLLTTIIAAPGVRAQDESPPEQRVARIEQALSEIVNLDFNDVPLFEVCQFLQNAHNINVALDKRALDDIGLGADNPVTFHCSKITLSSALKLMLRSMDLIAMVRDETLVITTFEEAEARLVTKVYPVPDLVAMAGQPLEPDFDSLIKLITATIAPATWDEVGGPASTSVWGGSLIISQLDENHRAIHGLLAGLRNARRAQREGKPIPPYPAEPTTESTERISAALNEDINLSFRDVPLEEVVQYLAHVTDCNVMIDHRALEEVGLSADQPVSIELKNVSMRAALKLMLTPYELTHEISHEVLLITTPEYAESRLAVQLYPVYDLARYDRRRPTTFADEELKQLVQTIQTAVAPDHWENVGGPGSIGIYRPSSTLVISQTGDTHRQVQSLLNQLRAARGQEEELLPSAEVDPLTQVRLYTYHLTLDPQGQPAMQTEELLQLLHRAVEGVQEKPGHYLQVVSGELVVKQPESVHAEIQKLFTELGVWQPGHRFGFGGGGGASGGKGGGFGGGGGMGGGRGGFGGDFGGGPGN